MATVPNGSAKRSAPKYPATVDILKNVTEFIDATLDRLSVHIAEQSKKMGLPGSNTCFNCKPLPGHTGPSKPVIP